MKLVLVRVIIGTGKDQRGYLCVVMQMFYLQCHAADSTEKDKMQQENALSEFFFSIPEIASSIFLRAPKVVIPSSFRSWSVSVRNVWRSI